MAVNVPTSQLPAAPALVSTDLVPIVHAGNTMAATIAQLIAALRREAVVTNVPADGGNTPITFTTPFASTVGVVSITPSSYNGTDNPLITWRLIGEPNLNGFTVTVGGGQAGKTVSLHYRVSGT